MLCSVRNFDFELSGLLIIHTENQREVCLVPNAHDRSREVAIL